MQDQKPSINESQITKTLESNQAKPLSANSSSETAEFESVVDVSGKNLEFSLSLFDGDSSNSADGLYVYRNVFNLIPKSLGSLGKRLKKLKFFANEVNLFPPEIRDLVELQSLQVKVSSIGISGFPFSKLKALKELQLSRAPLRSSSGFPILAEISALKCLTKLSVCHFSIRENFRSIMVEESTLAMLKSIPEQLQVIDLSQKQTESRLEAFQRDTRRKLDSKSVHYHKGSQENIDDEEEEESSDSNATIKTPPRKTKDKDKMDDHGIKLDDFTAKALLRNT